MLVTMFKNVRLGWIALIFFIPQPNMWYKFHEFPLGKDFLDFLFLSIFIGALIQKKEPMPNVGNNFIIIVFLIASYFSLLNSSLRFSLPLPVTTSNFLLFEWKNYAQMILLYFITLMAVRDDKDIQNILYTMAIAIFLIAFRNYRNFSGPSSFRYDRRASGPFFTVGLGANHFGSFIAHYASFFLGLFVFEEKTKIKLFYLLVLITCLHPLFFSYSRGAYLATFGAIIFIGCLKKRTLLIGLLIVVIGWQTLLPVSVVERISMTQDESGNIEASAGSRFELWDMAIAIFQQSPIIGVGYNGFAFSIPSDQRYISAGIELTDTHNFFVKLLCEQGLFGLVLFFLLMAKAFMSGFKLYRTASKSKYRGLGLGFCACIIATLASNMFGDRWSYFVMGSYFWIIWGLVDKCLYFEAKKELEEAR